MIPWSEQSEQQLRNTIRFSRWQMIPAGGVFIFGGVVSGQIFLFVIGVFIAAFGLIAQGICSQRLSQMTVNRPFHGSKGLTNWLFHLPATEKFVCSCGRAVSFKEAHLYRNIVDPPGGGRYSFVCECGQGHYKHKS